MASVSVTYKTIEGSINAKVLKNILCLYTEIFEDADLVFFKQRIESNKNTLYILAYNDRQLVGFKIGYPYNDTTFYSWIGGVLAKSRQQGIATQLAKLQENYAINEGFSKLRTKSMNHFKPMMILNLKNGFDIVKIYTNDSNQTKIVFEKQF